MDRDIAGIANRMLVARLVGDGATSDYLDRESRLTAESSSMPPISFPANPADRRMGARLALISLNGAVRYIASIGRELADDPIRRKFEFAALRRLDLPLPDTSLASVLSRSQSAPLGPNGGPFTRRASATVLGLLTSHQPSMVDDLASLFRSTEVDPDSKRFTEKTATTDSLMFSGAGRELDEHEVSPKEGDLLARDALTFLDWSLGLSDTIKVRRFEDRQGRVLKVMVVDHDRFETEIGPDLIYYHKQRKSFVLVQCKRMVLRNGKINYHADEQLDKQLAAMGDLYVSLKLANSDDSDYRLLNDPSFVKLCHQQTHALDPRSMVSGMCLPRAQMERHLRQSRTLSYETVHDSMTSTDFCRLVAIGLLGSTPAASKTIRETIKQSYGCAVFSEFSDESGRRPATRSRLKRRPVDRRESQTVSSAPAVTGSTSVAPGPEQRALPVVAEAGNPKSVSHQDTLFD